MADGREVAVAALLLGCCLFSDFSWAAPAITDGCSSYLSVEAVLKNHEYQEHKCENEACSSGILAFYNKKVNNGSSTTFACVVFSSSAEPQDSEITLTSSAGITHNGNATFLLSADGTTAAKVFFVEMVSKEQNYSCHFMKSDSTGGFLLQHDVKKAPDVYVQPRMVREPRVEELADRRGVMYAVWPKWTAGLDEGDGPVESYAVCFHKLPDDREKCQWLEGSWPTWVSVQLSDLQPGSTYKLSVYATRHCLRGTGLEGPSVEFTVPCKNPKGELNISAFSTVSSHNDAHLNVTWKLPQLTDVCDVPEVVVILLTAVTSSEPLQRQEAQAMDGSYVLSVQPDTMYTLSTSYLNKQAKESNLTRVNVTTGAPFPDRPTLLGVYMSDNTSLLVEWSYAGRSPKSIVQYEVYYKKSGDASNVMATPGCILERPFSRLECVVSRLVRDVKYQFSVKAKTSAGYGDESNLVLGEVKETKPQPVYNVRNVSRTSTSVELEWQPPTSTGGLQLLRYEVDCASQTHGIPVLIVEPHLRQANVTGLLPNTQYQCRVRPKNKIDSLVSSDVYRYVSTLASRPHAPSPPQLDDKERTATSVGLRLPATPDASVFKVVVVRLDDGVDPEGAASSTPDSLDNCPAYTHELKVGRGPSCYTAAILPATVTGSLVFVVGNNEIHGGFLNAPLERGARYAMYFAAGVVGDGVPVFSYARLDEVVVAEVVHSSGSIDKHAGDATAEAGIITGAVSAVAVVIIAAILTVAYMRRKKNNIFNVFSRTPMKEKGLEMKENGLLLNGGDGQSDPGCDDLSRQPDGEPVYDNVELKRYPVLLSELAAYVEQKKKDDSLKKEYMLIPWGLMSKCDVAKRPENKLRNRYGNIIAYDHSRVTLACNGAEVTSDYINANYIDGYNSPKAYIATQGPLRSTVKDFWQMAWQERAPVIVMLTNTVEMGKDKCDHYWPENGATVIGHNGLTVLHEHTRVWAIYEAHYLLLTKGDEQHRLVHFHFKDWPDHGVPSRATSLLAFLETVRSACTNASGPVVCHCSAGVGRTGTYIALDTLLRQAEAEGKVDVYGTVYSMRQWRCNMIQTLDQYIFLHEAVLEAVIGSNTSHQVSTFAETFCNLISLDDFQEYADAGAKKGTGHGNEQLRFEEEYEKLERFTYGKADARSLLGVNARRNRDVSIVPCEGTCVALLNSAPGTSDYINACFVDDYHRKGALISTQTPLPETACHFWKMIYDRHAEVIVMLNTATDDEEDEEQQFTIYWPTSVEHPAEYPQVTVRLVSEECALGGAIRTFSVTPKDDAVRSSRPVHTVTQYACNFWHEQNDVPATRKEFVNLLCTVADKCKECTDDVPLVVQCLDGARQTGLFLACHILMQQALADGRLNVFQVIKLIRRCRPQFICSADQLRYCYEVMIDLDHSGRLQPEINRDTT